MAGADRYPGKSVRAAMASLAGVARAYLATCAASAFRRLAGVAMAHSVVSAFHAGNTDGVGKCCHRGAGATGR